MLLAVFIYWGWDTTATVNEETEDPTEAPGKATVISTLILLGIYVVVAFAAQAYAGVDNLVENQEDVLSSLGTEVFGSPLDKLLIIAVLTSAAASTQTTILPAARTTLSMARAKAMPESLGKIHPRYLTPHLSTIWMGGLSILWYVGLTLISEDILFDSLAALGLMISFYIGITGFACAIFYRRELLRSVKNFFFVGVGPVLGGVILFYLLIKNAIELADPANSESGNSWLGLGPPLVIAVFFMVLGVVLMVVQWRPLPDFFRRKAGVVPAGFLEGEAEHRREVPEMGQIVVGYDGSDRGKVALDKGLELARDLGDGVVIVFGYAPPGDSMGRRVAEHEEAVEEFGEKVMGEARERAKAGGVPCDVALVAKRGADALIEVAEERDARMIVVGSQGETPIKGVLLGSTPHKLLHISPRPVLVVPTHGGS